MWFTASLLICTKRVEPEVTDLEARELPAEFRQAIGRFLRSAPSENRQQEWQREQLLQNFCRYAKATGAEAPAGCNYVHLLGYLEHRSLHGIPQNRLKQEGQLLTEFLRFLWHLAGKTEDPLEGEDLNESLEWLDGWYEESIVLLQAESEKEAWQRAEAFGKALVAEYQREANPGVRWEFVGVLSVYEVLDDELRDGSEVFSRFLKAKEAKALMKAYRLTKKERRA